LKERGNRNESQERSYEMAKPALVQGPRRRREELSIKCRKNKSLRTTRWVAWRGKLEKRHGIDHYRPRGRRKRLPSKKGGGGRVPDVARKGYEREVGLRQYEVAKSAKTDRRRMYPFLAGIGRRKKNLGGVVRERAPTKDLKMTSRGPWKKGVIDGDNLSTKGRGGRRRSRKEKKNWSASAQRRLRGI